MRRPPIAYLALAIAALLFGATFVVVKEAIESLPPFSFVGWRFLIGAVALLLLAWPRGSRIWRDGLLAGIFLALGFALQTQGLLLTSASNSALITGLFVVFTPLLMAVIGRRVPNSWTTIGALVAFFGLAMLTIDDSFQLHKGDLLTVLCALAFACHIVVLSRVAYRHPVVPFTAVQLLTTAVGALVASTISEGIPLPTSSDWPALLLTGLAVSAGAFTLHVWAQTVVGPSRTAMLLALEPVFAVAFAAWWLNERLTTRGWVGAILIVGAVFAVLTSTKDTDPIPAAEAISPAH
ncbi:MAG: DMT family transporter [Acidimicrobiia bacterium]|nr:DMT family transporter [Acidimicrobiia bacterium]